MIFRGVAMGDDKAEDDLADEIADVVDKTLEEAAEDKVREIDLIQEDLHDDIAEFVWKKLKRRPLVLPVVESRGGRQGSCPGLKMSKARDRPGPGPLTTRHRTSHRRQPQRARAVSWPAKRREGRSAGGVSS